MQTLNESREDGIEHDDLSIARAVEEDIIFGRLAPGTRLTEDALLARFHVTRHFARQAIVQLETMGIVVRERNKGATVRSLTARQVQEIYDVRELLQRQAALWIKLPAPEALIEELLALHDEHGRHVESGYLRGVHEANDKFHLTLFGACGNAHLVQSIELYMRLSLPVRANSMSSKGSLRISHEHHRLMIEMLRGEDNWVLAQLCVDHLQPSKKRYLAYVSES
ncbi:GntR family transcriptional regulator [Rhizobium laguerreae]|uniref:GntR family transcriptional regulator n=1 Tax=Rhizobium laguerreae TaxID=1076926 RepID=UPI00103E765E|nr:GntR family transcriptional regulator [Rhizobium laguerreae]MBY3071802.1 GntR family transcriptional regulator [Rhizobium laguerreae]MBY3126653.1 GntR family transcriptional regulator [Rhizobium laguerreae]MBY3162180.1 GntR family transcriptional regulator [Rhizobium laguerreae]MBY3256928.1 GntR family transcriptional regulator [Rhizobium laguerreae]MBY3282289.1 GntR family transcriptional regulator [Rhizobium laguerreae]